MSILWCNGRFVDQLILDPAERGLMLGDGIFETIAVRHARPIWCDEHLTRMQNAAAELGLQYEDAKIRQAVRDVLKKSMSPTEVLRITLTRGPTPRGLNANGSAPSLILSLNPFDRTAQPKSIRLATSTIRRNDTSPASRLKTLSYIDNIAAAREVQPFADDALMLNTQGRVASTPIANIFLLKGKTLITPSSDQAILKGIARQKLLQGAVALGLQAEERAVNPNELKTADCVFLTNSLRLATPVSSIDGKPGETGDISVIQDYYESLSKGEQP